MRNDTLTTIYIILSVFAITVDILTACHSFWERKKYSNVLGGTCLVAASVQATYLLSVLSTNYLLTSVLSSLYFISISLACVFLLTFIRCTAGGRRTDHDKKIISLVKVCFTIDTCIFLVNPFAEISATYVEGSSVIAKYQFERLPLYWFHLVFVYLLLTLVLYHLIKRTVTVPMEYRNQYLFTMLFIAIVVAINAVFLFVPDLFGEVRLDYSIWGYSITVFSLYFAYYRYPDEGMKAYYHKWIVENVEQGVVLFNFENELLIVNDHFRKLFPENNIRVGMSVEEFTEELKITNKVKPDIANDVFQMYTRLDGRDRSVRVDCKLLLSKSNPKSIGIMYIFTDKTSEVDALTSFHNWEAFKSIAMENPEYFHSPFTVAVCDINGLREINSVHGNNVGDQLIESLANTIRTHFTGDCHFIRGNEANLIVLCFDTNEEETKDILSKVHEEVLKQNNTGCSFDIQSAIAYVTDDNVGVLEAIDQASKSMRNKKLLDVNSRRSELVMSLVKTLAECDNDTEEHVKRTQLLGAELGKRLGLTDMQQSDLALLCLLHDIGKIGIPLEILNKPGRLNDSEWRMMKTHTAKGYQIATSSQELSHIADMILHHHEAWDGHGYPDGLKKDAIPLLSRIISVVDAYDAMVNDRAYRQAMSVQDAVKELRKCAGTQFDPMVVNEFIRILPEINKAESEFDFDIIKAATSSSNKSEEIIVNTKVNEIDTNVHPVAYSRYVLDDTMRIIEVDSMFETLTGYSAKDIADNEIYQADIIPDEDVPGYFRLVTEQLSDKPLAYFEHRIKRKDGAIIFVFCYGRVFYDSAVKAERSEVIIFDSANTYSMRIMLSEEYKKSKFHNDEASDISHCDSLTGLLSDEVFKREVMNSMSDDAIKIMMLLMDIDDFKGYNAKYGREAGNELLRVLSNALTGTLRKNDLACRFVGDQFVAALFYDSSVDDKIMLERARQICDKINLILAANQGGTSMSMGVVITDDSKQSFDHIYEGAIKALYDSKNKGKALMTLYSGDK